MKKIIYYLFLSSIFYITSSPASFAQNKKTWSVVMAKQSGLYGQDWFWNKKFPEKQISDSWKKGKYISDIAYGGDRWVIATSQGTGYTNQSWSWRTYFPQKEIQEAWDKGFYITNLVYGQINGKGGWTLVVSKTKKFTEQRWYTRTYFPKDEIQEAWNLGFNINSVTYGNGLWAVFVSKEQKYKEQTWHTRKYFPRDEIQKGWDKGFRITSLTHGNGTWILIMTKGTGLGEQRWYTTPSDFPKKEIQEGWDKGFALMGIYAGYKKAESAPLPKPTISWQQPSTMSVSTTNSSYRIKVCIDSETDVISKQVYVNGQLTRGFEVVEATDGCTEMLDQTVQLNYGANRIKVVVQNKGGTTTSKIHTINYQKPSSVHNNTVQEEKKVALIIGNGKYHTSPLKNPANDAGAIAKKLRGLGFEVLEHLDATHEEMEIAISEFGKKIKNGGVGLFYYAGHGIQFKGNNYLVPVDAKIESETEVKFRSVNLGLVLAKMEDAKNRMNIVILDACRNNPFKRSWRSAEEGLATTLSPTGTFIAYATSPGSVAADGTGKNGLYTQELLKAMEVPNTKIEDVFKKVRSNVRKLSGGKQVPWESSSIEGDFFFNKK